MKRTELTKDERTVLRLISGGAEGCPEEYPAHRYAGAVRSLERKGLVKAMYEEGGGVVDTMPTSEGRLYISENPSLRNPVNWAAVSAIAAVVAAIAALAALLITCGRLL